MLVILTPDAPNPKPVTPIPGYRPLVSWPSSTIHMYVSISFVLEIVQFVKEMLLLKINVAFAVFGKPALYERRETDLAFGNGVVGEITVSVGQLVGKLGLDTAKPGCSELIEVTVAVAVYLETFWTLQLKLFSMEKSSITCPSKR